MSNDNTTTVFTTDSTEKALSHAKQLDDNVEHITMSYIDTTFGASHHTCEFDSEKYELIGFLKGMLSDDPETVENHTYDGIVITYDE
jgi:hypothetical protein